LVFVFFFFGRLWCSVCPLSQAAKLTKKLFKEGRPPPKWMKRHSWIFFPAGFVTILWAEHVFHMVDNPAATGVLLVALIALASIFAVVFKRETWCRYLCPLGSLGAVYSLPATLNVRSNPNVCATMCTTHDCNKGNETQSGCPVFHHPLYAREAHVCKLCFDCLKSCTHDSAKLYLRPPLIRLWKQGELGGALGLFALVVFAVSPLLLGSQSIEVLSDPLVFTTLLLGCVALAVTLRKMIKVMIVAGPAHIEAAVSRIVFILLLLGWGPLAAFQIANFPAADSLTISGSLGPVWGVLITESGISLLTVLQSLAILFSGALAVTALWGIKRRFSSDEIVIKGLGRQLLVGLAAGYLSLNLLLVLAA
jgi:hypothetical protein